LGNLPLSSSGFIYCRVSATKTQICIPVFITHVGQQAHDNQALMHKGCGNAVSYLLIIYYIHVVSYTAVNDTMINVQ
jgi:hypothetical protein